MKISRYAICVAQKITAAKSCACFIEMSFCLRRSPGGTPMRPQNTKTQEPLDSDPASIIATALRKKFANRVFQDSPGKKMFVCRSIAHA